MPSARAPPGSLPAGGLAAYTFVPQTADSAAGRGHLKSRGDIVMPLREEDAAEKLFYDPKTIARDVLIAAGRHPTEETLNHHLLRLRDVFIHVDSTSDFAAATGHRRASAAASRASAGSVIACSTEQHLPASSTTTSPTITTPRTPSESAATSSSTTADATADAAAPRASTASAPAGVETARRLLSFAPSGAASPTRLASIPAATSPAKPAAFFTAFVSAHYTHANGASGGNDRQETGSTPWQLEGAAASRIAAEVLKKHVFKVHVSQQLTCGWKGCSHPESLPAALLFKHVKKDHLDPVAWRLGDGPSVPGTVGNNAGGSLGPLGIPDTARPGSEDSLIFPASASSIRAFNKVHGNNTPQEKTREIFKAVQRLKEQIGVGLDPGGCELATSARNERVSNEEEVYEVVPAS
ncbi:hypothetical protein BO78DRAFT_413624 [Aspergillus sclerotiicarbonarius CBS 121057]|uniref:Uncharacterized protein n=1 Tax=Aspergillus sclerotiicarbonarius (strain CBS 121057 / IBT 28362) TaxID=1448318 RepID=A0A319ERD3_ASPSB|nr:hypothetical protein BO78DRAFT_413624 [Aspergillus sclerotiicarbonarius CBS 121057]